MVGGVENSVKEAVERLRALGHHVTVIAPRINNILARPNNQLHLVPTLFELKGNWGEIFFCPSIFDAIKKSDFEIAHGHTPRKLFAEAIAVYKLLSRRKFPYVLSVRLVNTSLSPFLRAFSDVYRSTIERLVFQYAKRVVVQTQANKKLLVEACGIDSDKIEIVPNGVDTNSFDPTSVRKEVNSFKQKYGLEDKKIVLFVGRLTGQKGLEYVIKAIPRISKEIPQARLLVVGEGPLKDHLRELCESLNVASNVTFLGPIDHELMPLFYGLSDVFILPSLSESFPNVLLEAMAMRKPVVATTAGVIPEIIENEETALLVPPSKTNEIANAVIRLLADDGFSQRLGDNAREFVQKSYSWEAVVDQLTSIYKEALN